ncbi:DUF2934 domain-containing protein [Mesorhizobium sp. ES1-1]|nr:DUF2934 domain-containing protein [Mesorhizobium sp. ES1-1]MBZ9675439.1 DUF2934 domain-containing protein [Mesorhizobium sp. ES1-1]
MRDRAYQLWDADGRQHGSHEHHWHQAAREIDDDNEGGTDAAR